MAIKDNKIPSPETIKSTPQSFSEKELDEIKELRNQLNNLSFQFGSLNIRKIKLKEQETFLRDKLKDLEASESKLAKSLTAKYGKGSLDIDTGKFTPSE